MSRWFYVPDPGSAMQLTDEETARLREIQAQRTSEQIKRVARIDEEQASLLAQLQAAGLNIHAVSELLRAPAPNGYEQAVPILLRHLLLPMPYSDVTKDLIARCLGALPQHKVAQAWPLLVAQYHQAPMGVGIKAPGDTQPYPLSAKDGLAYTLAAVVTAETLPELIALAKDRCHGESRLLLLYALKQRRDSDAMVKQALAELAHDPDLRQEIASW